MCASPIPLVNPEQRRNCQLKALNAFENISRPGSGPCSIRSLGEGVTGDQRDGHEKPG
ncbi:hypothetical protein BN2476_150016 [Paraburkholderia piptadeniae]|uniref:Uncharacterized protein n=1 Tax=Paraburkholderia piptadeniae TaxID=1701573 RepID=A0A1N7RS49_9BURK|nr:hypothetical protein BN2476_150016 [Paraburkholderia piptadeniae]